VTEPLADRSLTERLARDFTAMAEIDFATLRMYRAIALGCVHSPEVLELLATARPGQQRPVLLFASVHYLLLGGADHELTQWYPSVSGRSPREGDPFPAFLDFCRRHHDELAGLVSVRSTQTNEVNRSVVWAASLRVATADLDTIPVILVELGPSAGLNLHADRYAIDVGDGRLHGNPTSSVHLTTQLRGADVPDLDRPLPPVVVRTGIDLDPVDLRDEDAVRWLRACLWPEQIERAARFEAALAVTRADPPLVIRGDLVDDLPALLAGLPGDAHAVVFHSWVLPYVARARRPALGDVLEAAAAQRPVSWISFESEAVGPFVPPPDAVILPSLVGLTTWRDGGRTRQSRLLGSAHPHVAWLEWHNNR
jgi:hypothetical protein